jgi:hypothetical protein
VITDSQQLFCVRHSTPVLAVHLTYASPAELTVAGPTLLVELVAAELAVVAVVVLIFLLALLQALAVELGGWGCVPCLKSWSCWG